MRNCKVTSYEDYLEIPAYKRDQAKKAAEMLEKEIEEYHKENNTKYAHPDDADYQFERDYQPVVPSIYGRE